MYVSIISSTKMTMEIQISNSLLRIVSFLLIIQAVSSSREQLISCLDSHYIRNYSIYPVSGNYDNNQSYFHLLTFSIQNLRFLEPKIPKPVAIILPENAGEVVSSVSCCRAASLEIKVRCGGHSYEGTSSVGGDGSPFVIIDMMNLNQVLVDLETETAWVEGGATLGETYYAISQSSKVYGFSAGSCPTVGVGGHIGGGGFGLLSRKYGLAADNVIDALLITAEGKLLDRKGMGEDVFWAIRGGGGGNWGIVYAWKIRLLKVPETVTSFTVSRPGSKHDLASLLVNKWQHVSPHLDDDFYLSCSLGSGSPDSPVPGISANFNGFFLGPKSQAVSILTRIFPELNVTKEDCVEMAWIESVLFFSGGSTVSDLKKRYVKDKPYFKAKSDYIKKPISLTGIHKAMNILEKEPNGYVILDPYGGIMNKISSKSIPFPHRKGNLFSIQYAVGWHKKEENDENGFIEWIRELYDAMTPYVSNSPRAAYVNYMDFDLGVMGLENGSLGQDPRDVVEMARAWGEKYFLGNFDRLVMAKTVIDPDNVFSNEQGIPPRNLSSTLGIY